MKMAKSPPADGKEDTHVRTVPMLETQQVKGTMSAQQVKGTG